MQEKFGEIMEEDAKSRKSAMELYSEQIDTEMKTREQEQDKQMRQLKILREQVNKSTDLETAKQMLEQAGIASKEELSKAENQNKEALLKLTDTYISATKQQNEDSNKIHKDLLTMASNDRTGYADKTVEYFDYIVKGMGQKKMYQQSDSERQVSEEMIRAIASYGNSNYDNLDDKTKKIVDKIRQTGSGDGIGLNWEQIDDIINTMDNNKVESRTLIKRALGDDSILQDFTTNDTAMSRLGNLSQYVTMDLTTAENALNAALNKEISKERARNLLDQFKQATGITDISKFPTDTQNLIKQIISDHDLGSYAVGSSYIHGNGLAYLHEGEAVLTSTAAALLRSQTTEPISMAHGVSSALASNSSISREQITSIVTAIQDQTAALIAKMDEIYTKILSNNYRPNYSSNMVGLKVN